MTVQNLEDMREKHHQLVEDWALEMKALFLKDLPSSRNLDPDAITQLGTWFLDNLDSPIHRGKDSRTQLKARLSEALEQSDEYRKLVAFLDGLYSWSLPCAGMLGWSLSALSRNPFQIAWYDCIVFGLSAIMTQVLVLVYLPRKRELTWHEKCILRIAPFGVALGAFLIIFSIVCRFAWHIVCFGRASCHGDS